MASLSFIEKQLLEKVFEMSGGYVLNFSNRTFQSFIGDCLDIDVYSIYPDQSKANLLRGLFKDQKDIYILEN